MLCIVRVNYLVWFQRQTHHSDYIKLDNGADLYDDFYQSTINVIPWWIISIETDYTSSWPNQQHHWYAGMFYIKDVVATSVVCKVEI